jgi:hypothetical protein
MWPIRSAREGRKNRLLREPYYIIGKVADVLNEGRSLRVLASVAASRAKMTDQVAKALGEVARRCGPDSASSACAICDGGECTRRSRPSWPLAGETSNTGRCRPAGRSLK